MPSKAKRSGVLERINVGSSGSLTWKLQRRFYEPLLLLAVLGPIRGEQKPVAWPKFTALQDWPVKWARRLFLKELAYLCDHDTGGDTVTAMALQGTPQGHVLWVASNSSPNTKIIPFILTLLNYLKQPGRISEHRQISRVVSMSVKFGKSRVQAYIHFLRKWIRETESNLGRKAQQDRKCKISVSLRVGQLIHVYPDRPLVGWLEGFCNIKQAQIEICHSAYESFGGPEMKLLEMLCREPDFTSDRHAPHQKYRLIRHYIGRLGHHHKASRALVVCAPRLSAMFDELEIRALPCPPRGQSPLAGSIQTLEQMLGRMCPAGSEDLPKHIAKMTQMDNLYNIWEKFREECDDRNFQPRIHAEVQILDHLYQNKLDFADSDAFIACSKPACYCCHLYFKHHPLVTVEAATHQRIYRNWAPPPQDGRTPNLQRDVMNLMIRDIRAELFAELEGRCAKTAWHPDSTTGISGGLSLLIEDDRLWGIFADTLDDVPLQISSSSAENAVEQDLAQHVTDSELQDVSDCEETQLLSSCSSDSSDGGVPLP